MVGFEKLLDLLELRQITARSTDMSPQEALSSEESVAPLSSRVVAPSSAASRPPFSEALAGVVTALGTSEFPDLGILELGVSELVALGIEDSWHYFFTTFSLLFTTSLRGELDSSTLRVSGVFWVVVFDG